MDQSRSDSNINQHQNVHLHMHHVCNCQGGIYPAYYPALGYRAAPLPSLVSYSTASAVTRPYLQHYQYTHFNVGGQYAVPIGHVTSTGASLYGGGAAPPSGGVDLVYGGGASAKERRDREEGGSGDVERSNDVPEGYDYGQVTPPSNELLLTESAEPTTPENFVKFLERSCLMAEQIAYRNRNRPCFRNIQNLCIRTRAEILKPCTTTSNIHSQGIPWATKDFIYAFVRLTNCWHILKGYWENRDGSSLGKIEKELTPEFRACYVRWEKETIELAAELTRIFYNLDTNLNTSSSGAGVFSANNLVPPQVNLMKSVSESAIKKATSDAGSTAAAGPKSVRGILHLPSAEQNFVDAAAKDEEYDSEEERTRRVYMKPGSYSVPKKGPGDVAAPSGNSPRAIEFLETAQNVNKARETVSDRYWANLHLTNGSKKEEEESKPRQDMVDIELTHLNVHEWLISSNFADFGEQQKAELKPFCLEGVYDEGAECKSVPVTLLQRGAKSGTARKQKWGADGQRRPLNPYESKGGGLTEVGQRIAETMVGSLRGGQAVGSAPDEEIDLDTVLHRIRTSEYMYVNEVVRDLRYIIKLWDDADVHNGSCWLSHKLDTFLADNLAAYDFGDLKGDLTEAVGPLKTKTVAIFNTDCDQFV